MTWCCTQWCGKCQIRFNWVYMTQDIEFAAKTPPNTYFSENSWFTPEAWFTVGKRQIFCAWNRYNFLGAKFFLNMWQNSRYCTCFNLCPWMSRKKGEFLLISLYNEAFKDPKYLTQVSMLTGLKYFPPNWELRNWCDSFRLFFIP